MKLLAALAIFASSLGAPLLAADAYTLVFNRKAQAGQRFSFEAKALVDEANNLTINGTPARNDKKSATCTIAGEMEIVAVHASGEPREVLLKVTRSEATEDGKPATPFRAGDKIHVTRGDVRTSVEVQDQAATPLQAKLLDALHVVSSGSAPKDDEIFGPGRPVKAGEEWPVNAEVAAADPDLKKIGEFTAADIQGTVRCAGPVRQGETPCVKTRVEVKMSTSRGALSGVPAQVKVRSMTMAMTGETDLPLDPKDSRPWDTMDMTFSVEAGGTIERDGASQTIEIRSSHRRLKEIRRTPVK